MKQLCIIPARAGSSRFPNKPLALIAGIPMIERVWRIACAGMCSHENVYVATDDHAIAEHIERVGGRVVLTSTKPRNGTERVLEVCERMAPKDTDVVVNVQGDAVLTPPWIVANLLQTMKNDEDVHIATVSTPLTDEAELELRAVKATSASSGTLVVCDVHSNAMYFSKAIIPFVRPGAAERICLQRHVGIYGYRVDALRRLCALPATPCEVAEGLEQLRALEHGLAIRVITVDYMGRTHASVDAPSDIAVVERAILREGELV